LVVIDEQHRFGVLQRNAIITKGMKPFAPHLLMMSATPIPRTLALTVFGDLDVSVIRSMPTGRKQVKTYLVSQGHEQRVYDFVRQELALGHQAYFVYPRIESHEEDPVESSFNSKQTSHPVQLPLRGSGERKIRTAEEMYVYLSQQIFPGYRIGLIHSRIEDDEQHHLLADFRKGELDIVVATSVIEVGVDVPNANCMVIEHADLFGLAALHQLRGRVGRGVDQSHCFLLYDHTISDLGKSRLKALRETSDGFVIAEQDLELRGPGEVTGIQQSGYLTLGIADPIRDRQELIKARKEAFICLAAESESTHQDE
jgi:ATP-dependent DNA helicase RecG